MTRREVAAIIALGLIMLTLQFSIAGRQGLWGDEIFSLAMATGHSLEHPPEVAESDRGDFVEPAGAVAGDEFLRYIQHQEPKIGLREVLRAVRLSDTSPPLYYLLLHGWTRLFGVSDLALRSFSIMCGVGCLPFLVGLARRLGGDRTAVATVAFFVLNPVTLYYTTEGRMYALLWLCVVAVAWVSLRWSDEGGGRGKLAAWVVISVAGFLVHYFFIFPWAAFALFLIMRRWRTDWRRLLIAVGAVALLILPWYQSVPASLSAWRLTSGWLEQEPGGYSFVRALRNMVLQGVSGDADVWPPRRKAELAALVVVALVGLAAVVRLRGTLMAGRRLMIWGWVAAAVVGPFVFDLLLSTYTFSYPRYGSTLVPAAALLAGIMLASLGRHVGYLAFGLIVIAWTPNMVRLFETSARGWQQVRELAHAGTKGASTDDLVLVHSIPSGVIAVARYNLGEAPIAAWVGQLGNRTVPESLVQLIAGRERVFFIRVHDVGEPAPQEAWLREHARVAREVPNYAGVAVEFHPREGDRF